jgi:hypothetical protein
MAWREANSNIFFVDGSLKRELCRAFVQGTLIITDEPEITTLGTKIQITQNITLNSILDVCISMKKFTEVSESQIYFYCVQKWISNTLGTSDGISLYIFLFYHQQTTWILL